DHAADPERSRARTIRNRKKAIFPSRSGRRGASHRDSSLVEFGSRKFLANCRNRDRGEPPGVRRIHRFLFDRLAARAEQPEPAPGRVNPRQGVTGRASPLFFNLAGSDSKCPSGSGSVAIALYGGRDRSFSRRSRNRLQTRHRPGRAIRSNKGFRMNKIPVGQTIRFAYAFTFGEIGTVIGLTWIPTLINAVATFFVL